MVRVSRRIYADDSEQTEMDKLRVQMDELRGMLLKVTMNKECAGSSGDENLISHR